MPRIAEVEVYQFSELSDRAKETARDWYREKMRANDNDWYDTVYDDAERIATILGITFAQKPQKSPSGNVYYERAIYFGNMYCQGGGACFEGTYRYAKACAREIRRHAPPSYKDEKTGATVIQKENAKLAEIADGLVELQKRHAYKLTATVKHVGRYYHEHSTEIEVLYDFDQYSEHPISQEDEKELSELLRQFMRWIYRQLEDQDQYLNSAEHIDEMMEDREFEFDEDGNRWRE